MSSISNQMNYKSWNKLYAISNEKENIQNYSEVAEPLWK